MSDSIGRVVELFPFSKSQTCYLKCMVTLEEFQQQATELSDEDRAKLAAFLIRSLPVPADYVSDEEVAERARQMDAGEVEGMTFNELRDAVQADRNR